MSKLVPRQNRSGAYISLRFRSSTNEPVGNCGDEVGTTHLPLPLAPQPSRCAVANIQSRWHPLEDQIAERWPFLFGSAIQLLCGVDKNLAQQSHDAIVPRAMPCLPETARVSFAMAFRPERDSGSGMRLILARAFEHNQRHRQFSARRAPGGLRA